MHKMHRYRSSCACLKNHWGLCSLFVHSVVYSEGPDQHHENTHIQICRKFHLQKLNFFLIKNSDIFHNSVQNIDCAYSLEPPQRGGSKRYPQSMFSSKNKKNNVYPCKPQIYYIKVGFKGVKII